MMLPLASIAAQQRRRVSPSPQAAWSGSFTLTSTVGGSNLPFAIMHAFKQGDVPSGATLGGDIPLQVSVRNAWPDGSAKLAIISGRKTLGANTPATVTMSIGGSAASGSNLTTTDLQATGITASIDYGAQGSASWSGSDWASPFYTLTTGPECSSWAYRKQIGSSAHLVGWMELRLYANGAVEVLPWIENGYLTVSGPTEYTETATFTLGGTSRYSASLNLRNHRRAVLASGTTLTHWLGTNPGLSWAHDAAYLKTTRLVPNYRGVTSGGSALYGRLTTSYTPLAQAGYTYPGDDMTATGYSAPIGLLTESDAAYITTSCSLSAWRAAIINGYAAGRYGTHFRDQATNRPLLFASHPNLVTQGESGVTSTGSSSTLTFTPSASGSTGPVFDTAHHPSMGFMAYLITGWHYFAEELQFVSTLNYLKNSNTNRQTSSGIMQSWAAANLPRGAAWAIRTLAQAACATPDADTTMRNNMAGSLDANINAYHATYVAQSNNPLGWVEPFDHYDGTTNWTHTIFMMDFFVQALAYANDLKAHSSGQQTKMNEFLTYIFKSVVGRLGGPGSADCSFRYSQEYTVPIAPSNSSNFKTGAGPWYADWAEVARLKGWATDAAIGSNLASDSPDEATGYWANATPAISYAVDFGAAGADLSWQRVSSAPNYIAMTALFNDTPVWGVQPRT